MIGLRPLLCRPITWVLVAALVAALLAFPQLRPDMGRAFVLQVC